MIANNPSYKYSKSETLHPLRQSFVIHTEFAKNHERSTRSDASISLFPVNTITAPTCTKKDDVWISIHPSIHP